MDPKRRAAEAALDLIDSGMTVGLGTGSTATFFIDALGHAVAMGRLTGIRGIATSIASEEQARRLGLLVITFDDAEACDVTVDGADEIDPNLTLIKGLGGALLREKVVAQNSKRLVIVADGSKTVARLGTKAPVPVEVTPYSLTTSNRYLTGLGCTTMLRQTPAGERYVTDNGNLILDCRFDGIDDPAGLDATLRKCAGIVETGLFVGIATDALVADADGVRHLTRPVT